jgi:pimeloyl-ACP methyl ester carboxylesterase
MPSQRIETPDGISWHTETLPPSSTTSSTEEYVILIPSGEGDCGSLTPLAQRLSNTTRFTILTFDMPGFSRTTAPASAYSHVTPQLLATQIHTLLTTLSIPRASFFGCSSGGATVLALCALHPSLVKCGIVHEIPFDTTPALAAMQSLSNDEEIITACEAFYGSAASNGITIIETEPSSGAAKWLSLGPAFHARLRQNYITWVRRYVNAIEIGARELASVKENLQRRPIFWTVGGLNAGVLQDGDGDGGVWKSNFELANAAGLEVERNRLRSLHFPAVTVMEECAEWIVECVGKVRE